jgi:hypothetical protein
MYLPGGTGSEQSAGDRPEDTMASNIKMNIDIIRPQVEHAPPDMSLLFLISTSAGKERSKSGAPLLLR